MIINKLKSTLIDLNICEGDTDNTYDDDPNSTSNKCSNPTKLLVGFVFILFLFLLEYIFTNIIRKLKI